MNSARATIKHSSVIITPTPDLNEDMILMLQAGVFSLDGSEAITTSLSVDLAPYLDVYSPAEKRKEERVEKDDNKSGGEGSEKEKESTSKPDSTASTTASSKTSSITSSTSKRRRSMRTFSSITPGDLAEGAMDAAEKLGIDVAKRLKDLGAGPILKAAKDEVEKGREESERRKAEALRRDAELEKKRKEDEKRE